MSARGEGRGMLSKAVKAASHRNLTAVTAQWLQIIYR